MAGSYKKDESAKLNPEDLEGERKDKWLKRIAKENKELEKNNKVEKVWFEIQGDKLLRKCQKKSGGEYSTYHCNIKKQASEYKRLKELGVITNLPKEK